MTVRESVRALACGALAAALLAADARAAETRAAHGGARPQGPVALTPAALEWQPVPLIAGMTFARVWGAPDGPQARLVKIPANGRLPLHTHTATVRVVVISGTYVYALRGEPEARYEAGSFIVTPGGAAHVAGCSEACVYFEEVDGKPDFIPVAGAK